MKFEVSVAKYCNIFGNTKIHQSPQQRRMTFISAKSSMLFYERTSAPKFYTPSLLGNFHFYFMNFLFQDAFLNSV